MDNRIKSAMEIAMEKASRLGNLTPEEVAEMKWGPEGRKQAALYLQGRGDLAKTLSAVDKTGQAYVVRAMVETLLANLDVPRNEIAASTNQRVVQGIGILAKDDKAVKPIASRLEYLAQQYGTQGQAQLDRAYQSLRDQFTAQVQQRLQQQGMTGPVRMDIEAMPEFQAQWRAAITSFERPFLQYVDEAKKQLSKLALEKYHTK